jgi:hypothetical protein
MNANEIIIPCRLSYAHVWEPSKFSDADPNEKPKYSTTCLIDKGDKKTVARLQKLIKDTIEGGKAKWGGRIPSKLWDPLRDGDDEKDPEKSPEYGNCFFIKASSERQPKIIDGHCQPIMDQDEVYSGCYANVKLSFFAFANKSNGVSASLVCIQKTKDGESLGGTDSGTDGFDEVEEDEADYLN